MKALKLYINEALHINKDTKVQEHNYHPKTKSELKYLVNKLIKERGKNADLNDIGTSEITDMSYMFYKVKFNGDISEWDVSNVTDMSCMFEDSNFNGDISKWDVGNVKDMYKMFFISKFNGDISCWDVSNVEDMGYMFSGSEFNGDISKWDTSNVGYSGMSEMFSNSPLEKNLPRWYRI